MAKWDADLGTRMLWDSGLCAHFGVGDWAARGEDGNI